MPNKVEITEAGKNIVQISTSPTTLAITETTHTVEIAALTRAVGNATLTGSIDITNTIGDAIAGGTYASGTTLETVVRDLIGPFLEPSFLSVSFSGTGAQQVDGENFLVECGNAATVGSMSITWANPGNLNNATNLVITDTAVVGGSGGAMLNQDVSDYSALSVPHSPTINYVVPVQTTPISRSVTITTAYLSNNGIGSAVVLTKTVKIHHRNAVHIRTGTAATIAAAGGFAAFFSAGTSLLSTLAVDQTVASQSLAVNCTSNTANSSNFTYLIMPMAATLGEVAAEINGRGVADYTDSWVLDDNSGSGYTRTVGTASPTYKVYISAQSGAFDSDVTLNIELKHP
jgi:hypothetical protein